MSAVVPSVVITFLPLRSATEEMPLSFCTNSRAVAVSRELSMKILPWPWAGKFEVTPPMIATSMLPPASAWLSSMPVSNGGRLDVQPGVGPLALGLAEPQLVVDRDGVQVADLDDLRVPPWPWRRPCCRRCPRRGRRRRPAPGRGRSPGPSRGARRSFVIGGSSCGSHRFTVGTGGHGSHDLFEVPAQLDERGRGAGVRRTRPLDVDVDDLVDVGRPVAEYDDRGGRGRSPPRRSA